MEQKKSLRKLLDNVLRFTILMVLTLSLSSLNASAAEKTFYDYFPDQQFAAVVASQLNTTPDQMVTEGELTKITFIEITDSSTLEAPVKSLEGIEVLKGLEILTVSKCPIETLPESIGHLTNLKGLAISESSLTEIPDSISKLTSLQELNLSYNELTVLPQAITSLTKLKYLNVNGNQLETLPTQLGNLARLESLSAANNKLTDLPESIGELTKLTYLTLINNQLTVLPEAFGGLSRLDTLYLSDNLLHSVPDSFYALPNLRILYAENNQLSDVSRLKEMSLEKLELTGNEVEKMSANSSSAIKNTASRAGICTGDGVRLRAEAGTNSAVLGLLYSGNNIEILSQDGDWVKVVVSGITGYISSSYIK